MKSVFFYLLFVITFSSCGHSQALEFQNYLNDHGTEQKLSDSVMRSLQSQNEIVIALASENHAWGNSAHYLILAKNETEWKGYNYFVNYVQTERENAPPSFNLNPVYIHNNAADSLLQSMMGNRFWEIKGDEENRCCPDSLSLQNCIIYDAQMSRLWFITKDKILNPAYYAPDFFEECCPGNADRKLFLQIALQINHLVAVQGHSR